MNQILCIAIALFVGLLSSRLMKFLRLPNVTGYLISGIIFGPYVLGQYIGGWNADPTSQTSIQAISWISEIALGFIAFTIGCSFKTSSLKAVGKRVIIITLFEALGGAIITIGGLFIAYIFLKETLPISIILTLGAIACATAPAATLMVIKQYKARGPLVDTLLPVVALDDAVALILFAILFQIATTIAGGGAFDFYKMLVKPILEILISLAIGAAFGFLISFMNKFFKSRNNRLIICIFSVFAACGIYYLFKSKYLGGFELSSLLMCMMIGAVYVNMSKDNGKTLDLMDRFTAPIYLMFFVISGASLDLTIFFNKNGLIVLAIAAIYILARVIGKWTGAFTGASISRCEPKTRKYLGFALIPQAGVAIGLATTANALFTANPDTEYEGALIIAIILTSTLVYELVGPLVSKFALNKAGEIPTEE